jgi:uncharacterized protein YbjT (DUF2867 family)
VSPPDQGRRHRRRAVAAQAFLADDLVGRKVALTGPQAMTNSELVAVIGEVLDRSLHYEQVSNDGVRQRFTAAGLSPEFADAYIAMLATTVDTPALVTTEVEAILGRPAVSWRQWTSENRDLFTK